MAIKKEPENIEKTKEVSIGFGENDAIYSKSALKTSKKYRSDIDVIEVLLDENKLYSLDEVDKILDNFKRKEV